MSAEERQSDRLIVAVIGPADCDDRIAGLAEEVGRLVASRGAVVLTGGRTGVMAAACRGARSAGGLTLGILKGASRAESRANPYVDIAVRTGLGEGRNWVNACAADALIAVGGSWGTLSEIALGAKVGKPVVLLRSFRIEADPPLPPLPAAETPEQAVQMAFEMVIAGGGAGALDR